MVDLNELRQKLPPVISRADAERLTGGAVRYRTLANLDSQGKGPKRFYLGRKACYTADDFIEWLEAKVKDRWDG